MKNGTGEIELSTITVSVIVPTYNEERYIEKCVKSLLSQDYPLADMEWIFVDGMSTDKTVEMLNEYAAQYPNLIRICRNPSKYVPQAMNIGIAAANGRYIIRLDAHSEYADDYITKCVYTLDTVDADNVGGAAETKSHGFVGNTIAKMLSSKFGVGNSQFRTGGESGYVDTVPFGAFRREAFEKFGGYDERLVRNQDYEMNYRIRKNGGKIYMSRDIKLSYYCRDSIKDIVSMAKNNGQWNVITMKLCPGSMGVRHFVPLAFVCSTIGLALLGLLHPAFWILLGAEWSLYLLLDILFSLKASSFKEFLLLLILFPTFHIAYGIGSLVGIFKLFGKKYR